MTRLDRIVFTVVAILVAVLIAVILFGCTGDAIGSGNSNTFDVCTFVGVISVLCVVGVVSLVAAVIEFGIWVRYTDNEREHRNWRVRASPFVSVIWFLIGFAMVLMVYLVVVERMAS
jgi:hypothetical protein